MKRENGSKKRKTTSLKSLMYKYFLKHHGESLEGKFISPRPINVDQSVHSQVAVQVKVNDISDIRGNSIKQSVRETLSSGRPNYIN